MVNTNDQGQIAEYNARQYLEQRGLTFVEQNVRYRFGEIDLVMKDGSDWVFVEVKYRSPSRYGGAVNALSAAQSQRIRKAASHYIQLNRIDAVCRFDVIAADPQGVQWIRDAF
ncbi:YraN family protein [Shewanella sp. 1CM18E]|uniref:YraN family protein n=1 Tax=Shewanella sp. 1CM18E TaxID=2929169 RepID=UPI0020BDF556|nr:YraN family protein [Shewanella sp. 1CM18E]MCK8046264.1 YraN family protein [Shewanella sp. 1CM18E]